MGVYVEKIDIFKELTPHSRTYELRDHGKKNNETKANKHLTLSYKNYLQNRDREHRTGTLRHFSSRHPVRKGRGSQC